MSDIFEDLCRSMSNGVKHEDIMCILHGSDNETAFAAYCLAAEPHSVIEDTSDFDELPRLPTEADSRQQQVFYG